MFHYHSIAIATETNVYFWLGVSIQLGGGSLMQGTQVPTHTDNKIKHSQPAVEECSPSSINNVAHKPITSQNCHHEFTLDGKFTIPQHYNLDWSKFQYGTPYWQCWSGWAWVCPTLAGTVCSTIYSAPVWLFLSTVLVVTKIKNVPKIGPAAAGSARPVSASMLSMPHVSLHYYVCVYSYLSWMFMCRGQKMEPQLHVVLF